MPVLQPPSKPANARATLASLHRAMMLQKNFLKNPQRAGHASLTPFRDGSSTYFQTYKALLWFTLTAMMAACSHDYQLMKMEEQVNGYGAAIRWNLFKKAAAYLAEPPTDAPDWQRLRDTKVTAYDLQSRDYFPSGNVMMQTVEIRYIPPDGVVEKTITDPQRWRFDDDKDRWVLETGLPY
jgi:hypothetical protein